MIPFALMAAGTALQVSGQYNANMAQAQAELLNAEFYSKQADFAKASEFRQAAIASRDYEFRKGAQISAYARGGVEMSGSATEVIAGTLAAKVEELNAIKMKGDLEFSLARSRSRQSAAQAATLQSLDYNLMQAGTTILGNAAKATDNNPNSSMSKFFNSMESGGSTGNPGLGTSYNPSKSSGYLGSNTKFNY